MSPIATLLFREAASACRAGSALLDHPFGYAFAAKHMAARQAAHVLARSELFAAYHAHTIVLWACQK